MRLLPLLLLTGCVATGTLSISVTQDFCEDVDPGAEESEMVIDISDDNTWIYRTNAYYLVNSAFDPDLSVDGGTIFLHEYWDETLVAPGEENRSCYFPGILLEDPPSRKWTIEWYDGGDTVPRFREDFKP